MKESDFLAAPSRFEELTDAIEADLYRNPANSVKLLRRGLAEAEKAHNRYEAGIMTLFRGHLRLRNSHFSESEKDFERGKELLDPMTDAFSRYLYYSGRGQVDSYRGETDNALRHFQMALDNARQLNRLDFIGKTLTNLAFAEKQRNGIRAALSYNLKALDIFEALQDPYFTAGIHYNLGDIALCQNVLTQADYYFEKCRRLAEEGGYDRIMRAVLIGFAEIADRQGQPHEARRLLEEARSLSTMARDAEKEVEILRRLGRLASQAEDDQECHACLTRALTLCRKHGMKPQESLVLKDLSELEESRGCSQEALNYFRAFYNLEQELKSRDAEPRASRPFSPWYTASEEAKQELLDWGREITGQTDYTAVMESAERSLREHTRIGFFSLILFEKSGGKMLSHRTTLHGTPLPPPSPDWLFAAGEDDRPAGELRPLIWDDIEHTRNGPPNLIEGLIALGMPRMRSVLYLPFTVSSRIRGCLILKTEEPQVFKLQDLAFIKDISSFILIALKNAEKTENMQQQNRELSYLTLSDPVTGLSSFRTMEEILKSSLPAACRAGKPLSVLSLEIRDAAGLCRFRGRSGFNAMLKEVARLIGQRLQRSSDILAAGRRGCFYLILFDTDFAGGEIVGDRISRAVSEHPFPSQNGPFTVGLDWGTAAAPPSAPAVRDYRALLEESRKRLEGRKKRACR